MAKVFIPNERSAGEARVAATPETAKKMVRAGLEVAVQSGAGQTANFADGLYEQAGARIARDAAPEWGTADVVLKVGPLAANPDLGAQEAAALAENSLVIGLLAPYDSAEAVRTLAERGVTSFAMELIPRTTRAQGMDALSSQASIAGYKAALLAAARLGKHFPLLMTAAGTIPPAKVVVFGGGVAGLQALATCRRLGAVVEVSDIRPAVQEQVESLGGRFIELPMQESGEGTGGYARQMSEEFLRQQREIVARHVAAADVVISTAQVPGKPAPRLVSREMVESMRPGSVIVDLAAEQGGNCELSRADEETVHHEVLILAPTNLAATLPHDASMVYARNVHALLALLLDDEGAPRVDLEDDIVAQTLLTHGGEIVHAATAALLEEVTA